MFGAFGCAPGDTTTKPTDQASADQTFKRTAAEHLAKVLDNASTRDQLISELHQRSPLALSELGGLIGDIGATVGSDVVPEVSLREPAGGGDSARLLVAWAPAGDEHAWTEIPAYMLDGVQVTLDPQRAPDVPVLVIETRGRLTMRQEIDEANLVLQRAGLQRLAPKAEPLGGTGVQATVLKSIRLKDDKEPWILGAAEIYAIVSGVTGTNDPQLEIVDMPYLDHERVTYSPNQIIVNWSNFQHQVANIQLFERDSNYNYKDLITAILATIYKPGSLAGHPVLEAIAEIGELIIAAMPASVFTNEDDYVDSFYMIEANKTYTGLVGAAKNATISLQPFTVGTN